MRKQGMPQRGEVVICRICKMHPNSAFAELIEYGNRQGMIHVSEVAKRWVRDIREFLKENQYVVCKILNVSSEGITLSVKRVDSKEAARRLKQFNREKKAEKLLDLAAKKFGMTLDQAYEEAGNEMIDAFGSLDKAFEMAAKNPEIFENRGMDKKWTGVIEEIAKKSFAEKEYVVKMQMGVASYAPNGIELIKKALSGAKEYEVKYIAGGRYMVIGRGKNFREIEAGMLGFANSVEKDIGKNGEVSYEILKG
ncbi:MAG: S1 RNA-binding domain-containing protein [Candidatus Aenigmarchaeota archaeon]|nr:S1 RNA-binding domain-containing protein [Candidatus Aenigmarchaeota archaeon]